MAEIVTLEVDDNGDVICRIPDEVLQLVAWAEGEEVEVVAVTAGILVRKA